jgi:hypothetical protein
MNTTTPEPTHASPQSATPTAPQRPGSASPDRPTRQEAVLATASLIGAPAFFGPAISFVLGPWLLLVLVLIGPFALLLTVLVAMALAAGLLAAVAAVLASPYLLIRHLHAHVTAHATPRTSRDLFRKHRIRHGGLGPLQPKGAS